MMTTFLPNRLAAVRLFTTLAFLLGIVSTSIAQNFRGKDGAESYAAGTSILNRYATLAASQSAGSLTVTVTDITQLNGSALFINAANPYATNGLSQGDLILIIQMQGADISTTDDINYGTVTNYNNTGRYELRTVFAVSGNTISLCQNLSNSYTASGRGRTQVIRVPRLTTLSVAAGAVITGLNWNGTTGGVVAIETSGAITIDGTVHANHIGFRGGVDDITNSYGSGGSPLLLYRSASSITTAGKGEGIAGNSNDYNTLLNGAYGRGAPANAGGGGNGHNSGGGGGSNAGTNGNISNWNGTGIKSNATPAWATAWNFESAGFATNVSTGGGRGGYSFSNTNQDALVTGPWAGAWGGDRRNIVGGLGGRPMDYHSGSRIYMGGGGGAGDGNNSSAGNGGNGGGIVYFFSTGNITGTGVISANGQNGYNTTGSNIDAAGGAGGGGAIIANISGSITGVSLQANGGNGGNQLYLTGEAEGPGGGGGGGYISTVSTGVVRQVNGGDNGISNSVQMTEFLPNGATQGNSGTVTNRIFQDILYCDPAGSVLPIKLKSFTAILNNETTQLGWMTESETASSYFELQRSFNGEDYTSIATILSYGADKSVYQYKDAIGSLGAAVIYYRLKMTDESKKIIYSETRIVRLSNKQSSQLLTYPNPVRSDIRITVPANWQGKKVTIALFDIAGKLVKNTSIENAGQTNSINLDAVGAGIYIVRATMNNETAQQRFIKQ